MDSASKTNPDISPSTPTPTWSHQTRLGSSVEPARHTRSFTNEETWTENGFDPEPRGARTTRVRVGGEYVVIATGSTILFEGTLSGRLCIQAPSPPPEDSEEHTTLKRRVKAVSDQNQAQREIEEGHAAMDRLAKGEPNPRDIEAFIATSEPRLYTLTDLHAAICKCPIEESLKHLWVGKNPLYCDEFDGCQSHEERQKAWDHLTQKRRAALLQDHEQARKINRQRRARFKQQLVVAQENLQANPQGRGGLVIYTHSQKERRRPPHVQDFLNSLPQWQSSGVFYEVVPQ